MSKKSEISEAVGQFKVVPHENENSGVELPNGLIKMPDGSVLINPNGKRRPQRKAPVAVVEPEPEPQVVPTVKGKKKSSPAPAVPPAPRAFLLNMQLPGYGVVPTQYRHVYRGRGLLVLGVGRQSFVPQKATMDSASGIVGTIQFSEYPGCKFIWTGLEFEDDGGVRCLVLVELVGKTQQETEEIEDDDEEEQQ